MAIFFQTGLLLVIFMGVANALECANYVQWENKSETQTASVTKPYTSEFIVNCDNLDYRLIDLGNNSILGISKDNPLSTLRLPLPSSQKKTYTCFKLRMNGTSTENGKSLALTHHGCLFLINVNESLKDKCYKNLNCAIQDEITEHPLKILIAQYQPMFSWFSSDAVVCTCGSNYSIIVFQRKQDADDDTQAVLDSHVSIMNSFSASCFSLKNFK
ncbi:hypothetical protein Ocin01_16749 [Orchesella cincta]|uniref:Uncharacterized protein n=1 Tax=Orchesella cincta TaxID=48709 RepID=A0A1D2MAJ3_ORCCI|nr:hypothetical protein Ocin01_16749 [Orchesella cincta]